MARYTPITAETVMSVKKYLNDPKYESLTDKEVAMLTNLSVASIGRIKQGNYDHLLNPAPSTLTQNVVHATIEYAELQHLFACEQIVKDILEISKLSDVGEDELYFPRRATHNILKKYVPGLVEERLHYLSTEGTDSYVN
jgi:hypothetical protein